MLRKLAEQIEAQLSLEMEYRRLLEKEGLGHMVVKADGVILGLAHALQLVVELSGETESSLDQCAPEVSQQEAPAETEADGFITAYPTFAGDGDAD